MWTQFFLGNIHFAINVLAALTMFAIFWLYFDAWTIKKNFHNTLKIIGFMLLTLSFLLHATQVETNALSGSLLVTGLNMGLMSATRILGYLMVIFGMVTDPIQDKPKVKSIALFSTSFLFGQALNLPILYPILAVLVGFFYLKRATIGLEDHLKKISLSFFILGLAEFIGLAALIRDTTNVDLYNLVAPFGPFWITEHVIELIAVIILLNWVFSYLLKRFETELFIIFTTTIVAIFLVATVTFTGLLLKNLQDETISRLNTDVKVLDYALQSQKAETLSDAQVLAQSPQTISGLSETVGKTLSDLTENFLLNKKESTVIITDANGRVVARGEDRERKGDSVSDDPLIKRALLGQSSSTVAVADGVLAPVISIRSATPIKDGNSIVGAVMTGVTIDNAFVDGLKKATGLEASIYGGNKLSATTLTSGTDKSRPLGLKETDANIKNFVLDKGQNYSNAISLLGQPYFGGYLPLKDVDNNVVGMLFVGRPQLDVLQTAARSIQLTYLTSIILLIFSIFPSYFIARFLTEQLK